MTDLTGRVWLFGDYIDTDVMFPGAALKLPVAEASACLFQALRPGWPALVEPGDIVVGGRSFGAGSARPVASLLRHVGVAAVLAESMSSLFQRNCVNAGLLAIPSPGITDLCVEGDRISLDLDGGKVVNERSGAVLDVPVLPPMMKALVDAGGVLDLLRRDGYLPPV
jgi:3-isopropylmalate/(R)-2-methylmalate dehydratase small subunit